MRAAEPNRCSRRALGESDGDRIVGIKHGQIAGLLRFEQACLGVRVIFESMMAVQMILRHIQTSCDDALKGLDGFQLEAGEFQHIPLIGPRGFDHRRRGVPMLPPTWQGDSGLPQNVRR